MLAYEYITSEWACAIKIDNIENEGNTFNQQKTVYTPNLFIIK